MQRRLITTNIRRKPPRPDIWCHSFARFLGRQLNPAEKTVISTLERLRHSGGLRHPVIIFDSRDCDTAPILRRYLDYRLATSPEGATALLLTPKLLRGRRQPRLRNATYERPERFRGTTPAFMLLLDAHLTGPYSPLSYGSAGFRRISTTLFPILDRTGFLIIHLRSDTPPRFMPPGIDIRSSRPPEPPEPPPPVTVVTLAYDDLPYCQPPPPPQGDHSPHPAHPPSPWRYAVLRGMQPNRTARAP